MKDLSIFYKIDPNTRLLFLPSVLVIVSLMLFFLTINTGYSKITNQIDNLEDVKNQEQTLGAKLEILRKVQEGLLEYTNASLMAVPDKNPVAWTSSLVKSSISKNELKLNRASARITNSNGKLSNVTIALELHGGLKNLIAFLSSTMDMAPIIKVKSMKIYRSTNEYTAEVNLNTFWADLPKKLPAINEPITSLNDKELEILVDIKDLLRPEFNVLDPQPDSTRQNPFR